MVPTNTVPQGISAMMAVDPEEADPQVILAAMTEAAENVVTAQVTYAAPADKGAEFITVFYGDGVPGGRPAGRAALCGCLPGGGGVPAPRRPACVLLYYLN